MTYDELLDKWIRKLGRDCTAGEIVHDLRHLEQPVRCKDCVFRMGETIGVCYCLERFVRDDDYCSRGERREDAVSVED